MNIAIGFVIGAMTGLYITALIRKKDPYNDEFSCAGCKNINLDEGAEPCCHCRREAVDYWEGKENGCD